MATMAATSVHLDPVTGVAGGLAFHTALDVDGGQVTDAAASATLFRGYEVLLEGRDARDAVFIAGRVCGVCGGAHEHAAAQALEMACGVAPPPFGTTARNILSAADDLYDLPTALFVRCGPDYSEPVMRATNPEVWDRAQRTAAPGAAVHGLATVADIMSGLTRVTGSLYRQALVMARTAREIYVVAGGKHPHPQTMVPGGISSTIDPSDLNLMHLRVVPFFDYCREVIAVWDDLVDFLLQADPRFAEVGAGPANFLDLGRWDDPFAYDARYENARTWGEQRWATPGVVTDGRLHTTDLQEIDHGIEEFVDHSYYEDWSGVAGTHAGPAGRGLPRNHPLNKATLPQPGEPDWRGKYSWATAPRWNGQPLETGAHARLCITAMAGKSPHRRFIESTGYSLRMELPMGEMPATGHEWHGPAGWNALERLRARAYAAAHAALVAYDNVLIGYDLARRGGPEAHVFTPYRVPRDEAVGVGFWSSSRGGITHHLVLDRKLIQSHQVIGGSTWSMSPRDAFGNAGPCEQAVLGTPLVSSQNREWCVDVLRAIHSFDPCMGCAAQ